MSITMICPVFFFLLCATITESLSKGDSCSLTNGTPGFCTLVSSCESVLADLLAGNLPDTLCEYNRRSPSDPIICCPIRNTKSRTTTSTTTSLPNVMPRLQSDGRGKVARQKCLEYSEYAYTLKYPPVGDRTPIRVSQCTIKSIPLIVGGEKAARKEFPHMAAIGYNKEDGSIAWNCGGSLISEKFVLTAAHCTYSQGLGSAAWARVGDLNLASDDDGATPVDLRIVELIRHPGYKRPALYHDIALLRLEKEVRFNAWIRPGCLHTEPSTGTGKAIATGWGRVDWMNDAGSDNLLKVTLSLVDSETCHNLWSSGLPSAEVPNGIVANWSICAGDKGKDTCQGDSGGPLSVYSKPEYYCMYDIVGITSIGKDCGNGFPGVYTRVYNYISWIEPIVWGGR